MRVRQQLPSVMISIVLHAVILLAMYTIKLAADSGDASLVIETIIADQAPPREEFVQELDLQEAVAETLNFVAGSVSTEVGGSSARLSQQTQLEHEDVVKDPDFKVNVGIRDLPVLDVLGEDLGEAEVAGEVGAVVEGYGAALDRITRELIRLMRSHRLLVVWLFDESGSMRDDQAEIRKRIHRVYEELKLVEDHPSLVGPSRGRENRSRRDATLLTAVTSFGEGYHVHTSQPTHDMQQVLEAIDQVPIDRTGVENMCAALMTVIRQFGGMTRDGRKLVLIVVSDESGDDGHLVEEVLHQAKNRRAPIYVLGRESVFGYPHAYVRWRHPETRRLHLIPIDRGPETPFAETLQFDGFRRREEAQMSGFGPYVQVRLARETGGIFFLLPADRDDLNEYDGRTYDPLDMREYVPSLASRRAYVAERNRSEFRKAIWDVIVLLNPYDERNEGLELPREGDERFPVNQAESNAAVLRRIQQVQHILAALRAAQQRLESVESLRAEEPSSRWRANYDLMVAQLYAYRVRLFQYAIALGQFGKTMPQRIENPKSNRWSIRMGAEDLVMPDPQQQKALNVTGDDLREARKQALKGFARVRQAHPDTPWSRRAEWEENRGFGATFREHYHSPRKSKPRPKPSPPPKL